MKKSIDKLDFDKLKPVTIELNMLCDYRLDEHGVHDELVKNVNTNNTTRLIDYVDNKIPDVNILVKEKIAMQKYQILDLNILPLLVTNLQIIYLMQG